VARCIPHAPSSRLCTVYIPGPGGRYATTVSASSAHDAARKAVEWFRDPFWKGPKPTSDTVLEILPMGGQMVRVRVGDVLEGARRVTGA
jgi:hypothetical protein